MTPFEDFLAVFKDINSSGLTEIQFGRIINEHLFDNTIDNIEKIIGLIRQKQFSHQYYVSNTYHEPGYYYMVNSDGQQQTFKKSFKNQKIDLPSSPDLRIIVNQDKQIDYSFQKNKKYNQVIQTQNICFKISEHTHLYIIYSCFDTKNKKYNLVIKTSDISEKNIQNMYELIQDLFETI